MKKNNIKIKEFIKLDEKILYDNNLDVYERVLYMTLQFVVDEENKCNISYRDLSELVNTSQSTLRRRLYAMQEKGYLKITTNIDEETSAKIENTIQLLERK